MLGLNGQEQTRRSMRKVFEQNAEERGLVELAILRRLTGHVWAENGPVPALPRFESSSLGLETPQKLGCVGPTPPRHRQEGGD